MTGWVSLFILLHCEHILGDFFRLSVGYDAYDTYYILKFGMEKHQPALTSHLLLYTLKLKQLTLKRHVT